MSAKSETQLEEEKRMAHALMHKLDADAVLLVTWRAFAESMLVSTVLSSQLTDKQRAAALRNLADALYSVAGQLQQMAEPTPQGSKH